MYAVGALYADQIATLLGRKLNLRVLIPYSSNMAAWSVSMKASHYDTLLIPNSQFCTYRSLLSRLQTFKIKLGKRHFICGKFLTGNNGLDLSRSLYNERDMSEIMLEGQL